MTLSLAILIILTFLGLCFGSFAGAQLWRLRARQLIEDKESGDTYSKSEFKKITPLANVKVLQDHSRCLHCGHRLEWYDLVPLASWISTTGRCRYCHVPIGYFEPLIELGVAVFFVVSFVFWPYSLETPTELSRFILWLSTGVMLSVLLAYDAKWFLLPDRVVYPLIAVSVVYSGLSIVASDTILLSVLDVVGAIFILSGIYLILWLISKGRWIGFGDVKLGVALGLLLGNWELAFLALFLANLIGCLIVVPGLMTKKLSRTTQVPFGPMLIGGFFIAALFGEGIISWYLSVTSTLML